VRILCNYMLKSGKENYGSEQYMVTVEAESEFNNIAEISDYLFNQAKAAVERQLAGKAAATAPETTIPSTSGTTEPAQQPQQEQPKPQVAGNGQPITEKQRGMIFKLLRDNFETRTEEQAFLKQQSGVERVDSLSRKQASRVIEALMDILPIPESNKSGHGIVCVYD
jgi:hypothetical protein